MKNVRKGGGEREKAWGNCRWTHLLMKMQTKYKIAIFILSINIHKCTILVGQKELLSGGFSLECIENSGNSHHRFAVPLSHFLAIYRIDVCAFVGIEHTQCIGHVYCEFLMRFFSIVYLSSIHVCVPIQRANIQCTYQFYAKRLFCCFVFSSERFFFGLKVVIVCGT